ncbi:MAG: dynamin family protein [Neobacillus sp.]
MQTFNSNQFLATIQSIGNGLEGAQAYISEEQVIDFRNTIKKLKNNLDDIMKTERNLQIGIVGEVKAGKSSFINSLIFNGKDILPKAPTPMTAALTKISYGEQFEAEIIFYDEDDWRIIEANAERADEFLRKLYQEEQKKHIRPIDFVKFAKMNIDQVPKEYGACKELLELADKNELQVKQYIGETRNISVEEQETFIHELNQYVGSNGEFTPLVKYTVIKLNIDELRGIEIVDTPGMNDPIVSRTIVTSDFLMNCDVVFFLSYAGQFISQEELNLLTRSLPDNSINHAYLIASKFDSAMLDYKEGNAPLQVAVKHTMSSIARQSNEIFNEYKNTPHAPKVLQSIANNLPPYATSGLLYGCALKLKNQQPLNEDEEHVLKQFEMRFEGFTRDPMMLMKLANIHPLRTKVLSAVKQQKVTIINERATNIIMEQQTSMLRMLRQMEEQARANREELLSADVASLQNKIDQVSVKLGKIRKNVTNIFEDSNVKAGRILVDTKIDVDKEINNHVGVKVDTQTSHDSRTRRAGFLGLRKESYTVTTTTHTAQVTEVVASVRKYVTRVKEMINGEFKRLFDIQQLKKEISEEVIGAFDIVSSEFNENEIRRALEITLNRMSIQEIDINSTTYDRKLTSQFSAASVNNEKISELQLAQERILAEVADDIKLEIDQKIMEIENTLERYAATFIDDIEAQLVTNMSKIKAMLADKEKNLKDLDQLIAAIVKYKKQLA